MSLCFSNESMKLCLVSPTMSEFYSKLTTMLIYLMLTGVVETWVCQHVDDLLKLEC